MYPFPIGATPAAIRNVEDDPARRGPGWFDHHWIGRYRQAATKALALYPGALGQLAEREILAAVNFRYLPDARGLIARLVADIENTPLPPRAA